MTLIRLALPRWMAATVFTLAGGSLASAQMAPYHQSAYPQTAQPQPSGQYSQYPQYSQPAYTPPVQPQASPYAVTAPPAQQPPTQRVAQYQPQQYQAAQYQGYQLPNYQAPAPGQRYAMADDPTPAQPEAVPAPTPAGNGSSAPMQYTESYPSNAQAGNYPNGGYGSNCNCNGGQGNWEGYVQAPGASYNHGCQTGGCETGCYNGDCDYGNFGGGGQCFKDKLGGIGAGCGRQWFFGLYALGMKRDNPSYHKFAATVDGTPAAYPYYPTQEQVVLSTDDIEPDWQWGAEVRFGSTFGRPRSCDPCGCGPAQRPCAWEVVYWGLAEDEQSALVVDALGDSLRTYGQINYAGLSYDLDGAAGGTYADRPLNEYMEYGMPVEDPATTADDVRVLAVQARQTFTAQNLELNFIRFPVSCGSDPCCPSRFSMNALCGVRYLKLDEDLNYGTFFTLGSDPGGGWTPDAGMPTAYTGGISPYDDNSIFHDISVDNELVGFQLGGNMNMLIGCKWSAFLDTQVGIYGNHINSYQRVWGGGGGEVTWTGSGNEVLIRSDKTDISFLTELRAGMGYQVGCNCRLTAAYRVLAITGVALAGEQIPSDWSDSAYVAQIDSNDSLLLHGVQLGAEWMY